MSSKKNPLTPLRQMTLNFGQKSSPKVTNVCKECGMIYHLNDKEDEQLHFKYHSSNKDTNILKYSTSIKGEKLVQEYTDGKCIVVEYGIDSHQAIQKALNVLDFVDSQLGINENQQEISFNQKSHRNIKPSSKFYLFISSITKKIVGFCLAEHIENAQKIAYLNKNQSTFTFSDENTQEKVKCGINRIWVASDMRRQGIASKLLDCVCVNFIYIHKLEPCQLAFSDPTEFGRKLARNYCKNDNFLIYNCLKND